MQYGPTLRPYNPRVIWGFLGVTTGGISMTHLHVKNKHHTGRSLEATEGHPPRNLRKQDRYRALLVLLSATSLGLAACGSNSATTAASTTAAPTSTTLTTSTSSGSGANPNYVKFTQVPIPPTLSVDFLAIDQTTHRLYDTNRTDSGVDVFDITTPHAKFLGTISLAAPPNGIVFAPDLNELAVGLKNSSMAIIDVSSTKSIGKVVASVPTGGKARTDGVAYDPKDKLFIGVNGDDGFVSLVSASTNKVVHKVTLDKGLEIPAFDTADGMFYIDGSGKNLVYEVNPVTGTLVKSYPVGVPKCDPHGISINPTTNQALMVCGDANFTVLWNMATHSVIKTFDQIGKGDAVVYDAKVNRWFVGAKHYSFGARIGIFSANPAEFLRAIVTTKAEDANPTAYDETNNIVYTVNRQAGGLMSFPLPA